MNWQQYWQHKLTDGVIGLGIILLGCLILVIMHWWEDRKK